MHCRPRPLRGERCIRTVVWVGSLRIRGPRSLGWCSERNRFYGNAALPRHGLLGTCCPTRRPLFPVFGFGLCPQGPEAKYNRLTGILRVRRPRVGRLAFHVSSIVGLGVVARRVGGRDGFRLQNAGLFSVFPRNTNRNTYSRCVILPRVSCFAACIVSWASCDTFKIVHTCSHTYAHCY